MPCNWGKGGGFRLGATLATGRADGADTERGWPADCADDGGASGLGKGSGRAGGGGKVLWNNCARLVLLLLMAISWIVRFCLSI